MQQSIWEFSINVKNLQHFFLKFDIFVFHFFFFFSFRAPPETERNKSNISKQPFPFTSKKNVCLPQKYFSTHFLFISVVTPPLLYLSKHTHTHPPTHTHTHTRTYKYNNSTFDSVCHKEECLYQQKQIDINLRREIFKIKKAIIVDFFKEAH